MFYPASEHLFVYVIKLYEAFEPLLICVASYSTLNSIKPSAKSHYFLIDNTDVTMVIITFKETIIYLILCSYS